MDAFALKSLNAKISVLDHGYIRFVESWGSDARIIEAARMSTDKGFGGWGGPCVICNGTGVFPKDMDPRQCGNCDGKGALVGDEKLLRFLYENKHATPFEMAGMTIEVQAPIFVFREWHRHRTQSYNEMSARYTPLPDVNYLPTVGRLMLNAGTSNKQAGTVKGSTELNEYAAVAFQNNLRRIYKEAQDVYEAALADGIPKELARVHLPVGRYSRMMASTDLRNWLGFLTLRMAPNAQYEIRQYANEVGTIIRDLFPRTWALFIEGKSK